MKAVLAHCHCLWLLPLVTVSDNPLLLDKSFTWTTNPGHVLNYVHEGSGTGKY
jgi:hypothetical protein